MASDSDQRLRILVVVAHPHDFTHGAGTCGIHASRGDTVTVVTMTNGSLTHNERLHDELMKPESERDQEALNQSGEEYAEKKAAEFREVCSLFGVDDVRVQMWPLPFRLEQHPGAVEKLVEIILDVRPHVLITQRPYYSGPHGMASMARDDHNETAIAVTEAAGLAATPDYGRQFRPHTIAATFYLGVYFMRDEIDFFVDIGDWYEQRVQAETLFESQGHTETFARKRIDSTAGNWGWYARTGYAEGFVRARPDLLSSLFVPESALARAAEPHEQHLNRMSGIVESET